MVKWVENAKWKTDKEQTCTQPVKSSSLFIPPDESSIIYGSLDCGNFMCASPKMKFMQHSAIGTASVSLAYFFIFFFINCGISVSLRGTSIWILQSKLHLFCEILSAEDGWRPWRDSKREKMEIMSKYFLSFRKNIMPFSLLLGSLVCLLRLDKG